MGDSCIFVLPHHLLGVCVCVCVCVSSRRPSVRVRVLGASACVRVCLPSHPPPHYVPSQPRMASSSRPRRSFPRCVIDETSMQKILMLTENIAIS